MCWYCKSHCILSHMFRLFRLSWHLKADWLGSRLPQITYNCDCPGNSMRPEKEKSAVTLICYLSFITFRSLSVPYFPSLLWEMTLRFLTGVRFLCESVYPWETEQTHVYRFRKGFIVRNRLMDLWRWARPKICRVCQPAGDSRDLTVQF